MQAETFRHKTGGFFRDSMSAYASFTMRNGWQYELSGDKGRRDDFKDHTLSGYLGWNQKDLFARGGAFYQNGRRQNLPYQFLAVNQGLLVTKGFSLNGSYNLFRLGTFEDSQTVLTGTYRLNSQEAFGGRLIQHDGRTNLYLSYGRRTRGGTDVFFLIGDPNSRSTRGVFTVKLVRPFR